MLHRLHRRLTQGRADDGFGLIELTVAMLIISVGLLGLMFVQVGSLQTTTEAGQRQASTALANRVLEQLRALPYTTLSGGLVCANLVGDPNVQYAPNGSSCTATFRPAYDTSINESVVVYAPPASGASQVKPLNPHVQPAVETKIGKIQYDVRAYVTRADPNPSVDAGYWLTVISTWTKPGSSQPLSTASRSRVYAPQGCLSANAAPFSGPCQAFFYSDSGLAGGLVSVSSNRPGQPIVDGLATREAAIDLAGVSTRIQSEQIVSTQSTVTTVGGKTVSATGETVLGGLSASSAADTDPASGVATTPSAPSTATNSGGTTLTDSGGGGQFQLALGTGTVSGFSTTASAASPACTDAAGTAVANGLPCATASATGTGARAATLRLPSLGTKTFTLGSVEAGSSPNRAWGGRYTTGTSTRCTGTSGAGCVVAATARALGTVSAGGLAQLGSGESVRTAAGTDVTGAFTASPGSATSPRPLVSLTGYTDGASSQVGVNVGSGTATRAGTLTYWNGSSFATVTLTAATPTATYPLGTVEGRYGSTTVRIAGSVTVTAPQDLVEGTAPCKTAPCVHTRTGGSVVTTLTYTVLDGTATTGDFAVKLDLGTSQAQSSFRAAPDA